MTNEDIIEELFCQKFEIDCLAEMVLKRKSERWVPNFIYLTTDHDHILRCNFALEF